MTSESVERPGSSAPHDALDVVRAVCMTLVNVVGVTVAVFGAAYATQKGTASAESTSRGGSHHGTQVLPGEQREEPLLVGVGRDAVDEHHRVPAPGVPDAVEPEAIGRGDHRYSTAVNTMPPRATTQV